VIELTVHAGASRPRSDGTDTRHLPIGGARTKTTPGSELVVDREMQSFSARARERSHGGRAHRRSFMALLAALTVILAGCGSAHSGTVKEGTRTPVSSGEKTLVAARSSAAHTPVYCQTLNRSAQVGALSATISRLAADPTSPAAHTALDEASGQLRDVAAQTTGTSRSALLATASALDELGRSGIRTAASTVNAALQNLAQTLQKPCALPKG
jgi:hypothetical protein